MAATTKKQTKKSRKSSKTAAKKTTRKPAATTDPKSTAAKSTEKKKTANDRPAKALALRRDGFTYREIAEKLGYPAPQGARSAVVGALLREHGRDAKKAEKEVVALTKHAHKVRQDARED